MNKVEPGSRVGAVLKSTADTVYLLGFGVYEGDFQSPYQQAPRSFEEMMADPDMIKPDGMSVEQMRKGYDAFLQSPIVKMQHTNPRIRLDDGTVAWGIECWWGEEAGLKAQIEGKTIINVTVVRDEFGKAASYTNL